MGHIVFGNFGESTLDGDITATATSFSVQPGEGANFPAITGGNYYYLTLVNITADREVVKATALSTDTFTVVRAQDGTTAMAFSDNDKVHNRTTAALFTELSEYPERTSILTIETASETPLTLENDNASGDGYIECNDEASALKASFGHDNTLSKMVVQAESGVPIVVASDTSHTVTGDLESTGTISCVDVVPSGDVYVGSTKILSGRSSTKNASIITYTQLLTSHPSLLTLSSLSSGDMAYVSCDVKIYISRDGSNPSKIGLKIYDTQSRATFAHDAPGLFCVHPDISTSAEYRYYNFAGIMRVNSDGNVIISIAALDYPETSTQIDAGDFNLCVEWLKKA